MKKWIGWRINKINIGLIVFWGLILYCVYIYIFLQSFSPHSLQLEVGTFSCLLHLLYRMIVVLINTWRNRHLIASYILTITQVDTKALGELCLTQGRSKEWEKKVCKWKMKRQNISDLTCFTADFTESIKHDIRCCVMYIRQQPIKMLRNVAKKENQYCG